jgi:hypothetical protein
MSSTNDSDGMVDNSPATHLSHSRPAASNDVGGGVDVVSGVGGGVRGGGGVDEEALEDVAMRRSASNNLQRQSSVQHSDWFNTAIQVT